MTFEIAFVLLSLLGMVIALILDKMRPGMILFSVVVLFLCAGILTPKEMLEGFSNKGMITVALLFLVSEGIRQSGAVGQVIKKLLPQKRTTVFRAQLRENVKTDLQGLIQATADFIVKINVFLSWILSCIVN